MSKPDFQNLFDEYIKKSFSNLVSDTTGSGLDRNLREQRLAQVERASDKMNLQNAFVDTAQGIAATHAFTEYKQELNSVLADEKLNLAAATQKIGEISSRAKENPLLKGGKYEVEIRKTEHVFAKTILPTLAKKEQEKQRDVYLKDLESSVDTDMQQLGFWHGACEGLDETDPVYQQNKGFIIEKVSALRNGLDAMKVPKDVKFAISQKINKTLFNLWCDKQFHRSKSLSDKISFANSINNNNAVVGLFEDGQCPVHCAQVPLSEKIALKNRYLLAIRNDIKIQKNTLISNYIKTKKELGEGFDITNPIVCAILNDEFKNLCSRVTGSPNANYKEQFDLFLTQTGFVPKAMQDAVVNLSVADIQRDMNDAKKKADGEKEDKFSAVNAYVLGQSVLSELLANKDLKFEKNGFFQQNLGSLIYFNNLAHSFSDPRDARKAFADSLMPNAERDKQNARAFDEIVNTEGFRASLANAMAKFYGDEVLDAEVPDIANAELQSKIKNYYCKTGDLDSAIEAGVLYQKQFGNYAITRIGTETPRFMKYAPELFYRTPFNSVDDINADFNTFTKLAYPKGKCFLRADKTTLREISTGSSKPSYGLYTYDEFNQETALLDDQNIPLRVGEGVLGSKDDDIGFDILNKKLKTLNKLEQHKCFNALP